MTREASGAEPPAAELADGDSQATGSSSEAADTAPPNPCFIAKEKGKWIDAVQRGTALTVCRSALWFDNLFGDDRAYQERRDVFGWLLLSTRWQEDRNSIDPGIRFRFRAPFPHLERRLSLLLGRAHEDDVVRGDRDAFSALPQAFREASDQDWLVGLGWNPVHGARRDFGFDVGANLGRGIEPYVKARYRRQWFPGERMLFRVRPTLYWRDGEERTGASLLTDFDRILGPKLLLRWRNSGVHDHSTRGVEARSSLTLYQSLRKGEALGYQASILEETGSTVDLESYGFLMIYRHTIGREWLYLDLRPGISWRQEDPLIPRQRVFELTVGVELRYGDDKRP